MKQRKQNHDGYGRRVLYSDKTSPLKRAAGTEVAVETPRLRGDPGKGLSESVRQDGDTGECTVTDHEVPKGKAGRE